MSRPTGPAGLARLASPTSLAGPSAPARLPAPPPRTGLGRAVRHSANPLARTEGPDGDGHRSRPTGLVRPGGPTRAGLLRAPEADRADPDAWESPADVAVATGIGVPDPSGAVVFGPPPQAAQPPGASADADRSVDAPPATSTAGVVVTDLGTAPPATLPALPDLAGLTDALYERIEHRLRSDLLHERERLGCLPDL